MPIRQRTFLLASLTCHLLLAWLLLARPWPLPRPKEPSTPVLVDLVPSAEKSPTAPLAEGQRAGISRQSAAPSHDQPGRSPLPLSALAPRHSSLPAPRPGEARPVEELDPWSPFSGSESGLLQAGSDPEHGALGWIYRKTQLGLAYPREFQRHGIEGRTQARLVFGEDGRFALPELRVRSDSPYLRVYVYRLLERTFGQDPVPANLRKWKNQLKVDCYLHFAFTESGAAVTVDLPEQIVGHKLYFQRRSVKSKLEWELGPLHGMFPVPAVGVDVMWFARQAKEAVRPSLPADDLAPYKADPLFSERMD